MTSSRWHIQGVCIRPGSLLNLVWVSMAPELGPWAKSYQAGVSRVNQGQLSLEQRNILLEINYFFHFFSMAVTKVPRKNLKEGRIRFTHGFRSVNTAWQGRRHDGEKQVTSWLTRTREWESRTGPRQATSAKKCPPSELRPPTRSLLSFTAS